MIKSTNLSGRLAVTFFPDTRIKSLAPGIESLTGYGNGEMVGRSITLILADRTVFEMPNIMDTVKKEGIWEGEIAYRDIHKNVIRTYGTVIPLSDGTSRNSELLLHSRLAQSETSYDGANFIYSDVGSRIRTIVHDLNNPLAVIMGSTQLLALNPGCSGKMRSDIEKLYAELEKMADVVEKLHGYAFSLCKRIPDPVFEENTIQHSA